MIIMYKPGFFVLGIYLSIQLTTAVSIQKLLQNYKDYVNESLLIEKQDKESINSWSEEYQVKLVDVTSEHRVAAGRHQQHSFGLHGDNYEWTQCLNLYQNETTRAEQSYYVRENECLKQASSADEGKRDAFMQIGREIRKWRRGYRYLVSRCRKEHPKDEEKTEICLVNYMEKDSYSHTFRRLVSLRLQAIEKLQDAMKKSLNNLKICLDIQFSAYLEQIRRIMDVLNRCYSEKVNIA